MEGNLQSFYLTDYRHRLLKCIIYAIIVLHITKGPKVILVLYEWGFR